VWFGLPCEFIGIYCLFNYPIIPYRIVGFLIKVAIIIEINSVVDLVKYAIKNGITSVYDFASANHHKQILLIIDLIHNKQNN